MAILSGILMASIIPTACSNLEKPYQESTIVSGTDVKTMPYKATVSKESDPVTRVSVDDDFKTLRFAEGDKLYIESTERSDVKGVLDIKSGVGESSGARFEGSLQYEGEAPGADLKMKATLVGTKNRGVQISEGKVTGISYPGSIASNDIFSSENALKEVIEAYSYLTGENTFSDPSFQLEQQSAFLKFHITFQTQTQDGTPSKPSSVSLEVKNNGSTLLTLAGFSTTEENGFSVIDFVMPAAKGTEMKEACVTSDNVSASFGGNRQLDGKVYYVSRAIVNYDDASLGDIFYSDGTFSTSRIQGKTPIGSIMYLGSNIFSENGVELRDGSQLKSSGLVLSLKNATTTTNSSTSKWVANAMQDGKAYEPNALFTPDFEEDSSRLFRTDSLSGYYATKALAESENAKTNYPACYYAWNYKGLPTPPTTTGWFLPSAQQWAAMMCEDNGFGKGIGGLKKSPPHDPNISWKYKWTYYNFITYNTTIDRDTSCISKIDAALVKTGEDIDSFGADEINHEFRFWSSSEYFNGLKYPSAIVVYTIGYSLNTEGNPNGIRIGGRLKWEGGVFVRPVLAF